MKLRPLAAGIGLSIVVALAAPAEASPTAAAVPGSQFSGYGTPLLVTTSDGMISFVNADPLAPHDLVAWQAYGSDDAAWCVLYPRGACPLFWTPLITFGETTAVRGVDAATPGQTYSFYCSIHPLQMKGMLMILPVP